MNRLCTALAFAANRHGSQMYGRYPYIFHLTDVLRILYEFHYDKEDLLIAGALHDTLEDKCTTYNEIKFDWGTNVADLVHAVTGVGKNRLERKADTLQKLINCPKAVPIKMADRLANIENSKKNNSRLLDMYKKEMPAYSAIFKEADPAMYLAMMEALHND